MYHPTNEDRAMWAQEAVAGLAAATSLRPGDELDLVSSIGDLLANLMHLCRQEGLDFEDLLLMGRLHFEEETDPELDDDYTEAPEFIGAYKCEGCGKRWADIDLKDIKRLLQRVGVNDPMPGGECPSCGALCYRVED